MAVDVAGQDVSEALGLTGEARLISGGQPGDLRSAQIAAGATQQAGMSIQLEAAASGMLAGFNNAGAGLDIQQGMARPEGWQPEAGPQAPDVDRTVTADNTFG